MSRLILLSLPSVVNLISQRPGCCSCFLLAVESAPTTPPHLHTSDRGPGRNISGVNGRSRDEWECVLAILRGKKVIEVWYCCSLETGTSVEHSNFTLHGFMVMVSSLSCFLLRLDCLCMLWVNVVGEGPQR